MSQRSTLASIQYLRAFAALAVAAHHTGWTHTVVGQAGVDVFFVISGFIMMHVSRRETTPTGFLRARLTRVAPLYWVLTLFAGALAGSGIGEIAASIGFWPHVDPYGRRMPIILQGWTLNYEMFFYLVFAVCLLLPQRRRLQVMTVLFLGLCLIGAAVRPDNPALATYTSPLLLEFIAGAGLYKLHAAGLLKSPVLAIALAAAGVTLLALQANLDPGDWRFLAWGGPSLLIVGGALGIEASGLLPQSAWLRSIGDSSYSLYLTQFMVLAFLQGPLSPLPALLALPTALAGCVAVGLLTYLCLERPLQRMFLRRPLPAVAAPL